MTTKHTPGPWIVEHPFQEEGVYVSARSSALIAKLYPIDKLVYVVDKKLDIEANARLIAAAPELLEAVKWLCEKLPAHFKTDATCEYSQYRRVLEAIAKAEGGAQ